MRHQKCITGRVSADISIRHIIGGFLCINQEWVIQRVNVRVATMLNKLTRDIEGKALREAFPGLSGS